MLARRNGGRPRSLGRRLNLVGETPRPTGSGGAGPRLLEKGQWAQRRFFGYPDSQLTPLDRPATPPFVPLLNDAGVACERSQYVVSVSMRELTLPDPYVGNPIPTQQRVLSFGVGVSALQVLVQWSLGAGVDNQLVLDIGAGFQMSLPATRIQMALLLPNGAIDLDQAQGRTVPVPPNDPITGGLPAAWNATVVWGEVSRTETYASVAEWQLTRFMFVPAGTAVLMPIPQGADFVEVFQTIAPAVATPFLTFLTAGGADVGQYSADVLTARNFPRVRIPGQAKFIDSGAVLPGADRGFSLIFTMRP